MKKSYYQTDYALGCDIGLCLIHDNNSEVERLFNIMWDKIHSFEKQFSRFIPSSELSVFNQSAGKTQQISEDFRNMLEISNKYFISTNGLFNIHILPALQKIGYINSFQKDTKINPRIDFSSRNFSENNTVILKNNTAKIAKNNAIDLSGIAKGFLADKLADFIEYTVAGYWLSIGGDIVSGGTDELGNNWAIDIDSIDKKHNIIVQLPDNKRYAVATSGTSKRHGISNNHTWHHIIDPKTGKSSDSNVVQSSVVTKSATSADILATCSIIAGADNAPALLKKHDALDVLLQIKENTESFSLWQLNKLIKYSIIRDSINLPDREKAHA